MKIDDSSFGNKIYFLFFAQTYDDLKARTNTK